MPLEDVSLQVEGRWEGERVKEWMRGGGGACVGAAARNPLHGERSRGEISCWPAPREKWRENPQRAKPLRGATSSGEHYRGYDKFEETVRSLARPKDLVNLFS